VDEYESMLENFIMLIQALSRIVNVINILLISSHMIINLNDWIYFAFILEIYVYIGLS
jgi:hypothetical protein